MNKTKKTLHDLADAIEQALRQVDPGARVTGGTVTPQAVFYNLSTQQPPDRQVLKDVCAALDGRLHDDGGRIRVEIPRTEAPILDLADLFHRLNGEGHAIPPLTAILGIDVDGVPLLLRLVSPHVRHLLILGGSGSGKTTLARTVAASLAMANNPRQLQLFPIGEALAALALPDHTRHTIAQTGSQSAAALLDTIRSEMEKRRRGDYRQPALVLVVDELDDLLDALAREEEEHLLAQLLEDGPGAGIHLVVCGTPAEAIRPWADRFPVLCLGATTPPQDEALPSTPPLPLPTADLRGSGDFLLVARGQVCRMQAAVYQGDGHPTPPGALLAAARPHLALAAREG